MKTSSRWNLAIAPVMTAAFLIPILASSQASFPEGRARDAVFLVCTQCHPLTRITDNNLTAAEWEFTLYDMISRGAPLHEADLEAVRQYLIDNFAVDER